MNLQPTCILLLIELLPQEWNRFQHRNIISFIWCSYPWYWTQVGHSKVPIVIWHPWSLLLRLLQLILPIAYLNSLSTTHQLVLKVGSTLVFQFQLVGHSSVHKSWIREFYQELLSWQMGVGSLHLVIHRQYLVLTLIWQQFLYLLQPFLHLRW